VRTEEFHNLLSTDKHSGVDIHEMKSLLDRHPYSHTVRLAYLKSLHFKGDDRLGQALDEAAIHLPDRKVLYTFMESLEHMKVAPNSTEELQVTEGIEETVETELSDEEAKRKLQRQYLTEAVQSSILLEVDEEAEDSEQEKTSSTKPVAPQRSIPGSFLDFITGESTAIIKEEDDELIARFLSNEKREKTEFFDPQRMATQSLDDSGGMVSDTLARIYINQGNLDKALEAYNQLILKYPEKSGYFAARIQKVEELKRKKQSSK